MKQMWKKITAVMLVIVMLMGMAPDTAVTVHFGERAYSRTDCRQF